MKKILKFFGNVLAVIIFIIELAEFLAIPAIFILIGIICELTWQFYVISIGGYFALLAIAEIIVHFVFKATSPILERKLERFFNRLNRNWYENF